MLLSLPATLSLAKAVQLAKGASSRRMNEKFKTGFAWQEGYGAFTVGVSQKSNTIAYIQRQAEHHRKHNFEEEFLALGLCEPECAREGTKTTKGLATANTTAALFSLGTRDTDRLP